MKHSIGFPWTSDRTVALVCTYTAQQTQETNIYAASRVRSRYYRNPTAAEFQTLPIFKFRPLSAQSLFIETQFILILYLNSFIHLLNKHLLKSVRIWILNVAYVNRFISWKSGKCLKHYT
jgi:hypothetical protein